MRAYIECAKKSSQEALAYRADIIIKTIGALFSFYLMTMFWRALYAGSQEVQGISYQSMITYSVISIITGGILNISGILRIYLFYWVERKARTGEIVIDLLRPVDFQFYLLAHSVGKAVVNLCLAIPIILVAYFVFHLDLPKSSEALLYFTVSLLIGYLLIFLIDFLISLISFWTTQTRGIGGIVRITIALLSGSFIPLWFFPAWSQELLAYLPFASVYHAPLSIYIGRINGAETVSTILLQLNWVFVLFVGSRILWEKSRKKLMIHGG